MCNIAVYAGSSKQGLNKYPTLNTYQKSVLEAAFAENYYLNRTKLKQLAEQTDLAERKILRWFARQRTNLRHGRKEGTLSPSECI